MLHVIIMKYLNYDYVRFTESGWQVVVTFCENIDMSFVHKASGTVLVGSGSKYNGL